jgi:hypothetical protein
MRAGVAGTVAGVLFAIAVVGPSSPRAQPAPVSPEAIQRARELYKNGEVAMKDGRFSDALYDYGAAYELTKDPVLFFKMASAHEKMGKCETAVIYYRRYLAEGKPQSQHVTLTNQRIAACTKPGTETGSGSGGGSGSGSAVPTTGSGSGSDVPTTGSGSEDEEEDEPEFGEGSAEAPPPEPVKVSHRTAWLLVGGSLTFATLGAVLAYSAEAAESDIDDLYVGLDGQPPVFDDKTAKRYQELLDEGNRYEKLSWVSFGLAGAFAIGAGVKFALDHRKGESSAVTIVPTATPHSAGITATLRF